MMALTRPFLSALVKYERCRNWTSGAVRWHLFKGIATNTIITQLGRLAEFGINSRFTCGGKYEVSSNKPIKLVYRQAASADSVSSEPEWSSVEFSPGNVSEADMIKLLNVCSVASYGYKGKDVVDKNYRVAFKLEPDNFTTSFQLSATPILQEIQSIVPTVVGLRAELYKLNIYARGGFFKAHVDTPRSERMFGSLVVCLPTQFTGGELIVRHHKEEIKYDWSSTASDTSSTLHWAAFFSDVEHEVLPVSEGYRVTLTYNLSYQSKASDSTLDVKTCAFYELLQTALSNPVFMRDGGVLGFNSHYSYVFDTQWADLLAHISTFSSFEGKAGIIQRLDRKISCDEFIQLSKVEQVKILREAEIFKSCKQILAAVPSDFPLLKGADYIVVESAKSLGLPVCVKPFLSGNDAYDRNFKYALKDFSQSMFVDDCADIDDVLDGYHHLEPLQMFGGATCRYKPQDITWCQELTFHQPAAALMHYGNEAGVDLWYKSAAILVRIPKWGEYRQKLIAISTGESCGITEASATHGDGMVKDFEDVFQDYEGIMREETQELNDQFRDLLDNKCISEVEGLVDKLKRMQSMLSRATNDSEQINTDEICHIRFVLHKLREIINDPWTSDHDRVSTVDRLRFTVEDLQRSYSFSHY